MTLPPISSILVPVDEPGDAVEDPPTDEDVPTVLLGMVAKHLGPGVLNGHGWHGMGVGAGASHGVV